jgi:hypothetical protein
MEFDTLHNILHYLYTDQIVFHTKPGKETGSTLQTVDVQRLYEVADQLLLFDLKLKAFDFLCHSHDIQNITARIFGQYAKTHEDLYDPYRTFFCARLPAITRTKEFDDFFDQIEDTDSSERINTQFRDLVQRAFSRTKLVSLPQNGANTNTEEVEEDDEGDSADSDYAPCDDEDEMEIDDQEDLEEAQDSYSGDSMNETSEESSDEEE